MNKSTRLRNSRVVIVAAMSTLIFATALVRPSESRTIAVADDPLTRITSDYKSGVLSIDDWAVLSATAIHHPEDLPATYALATDGTESIVAPGRGATLVLLEIRKNWGRLSSSTQQAVAQIMTRWSTAFTLNTPGGFFKIHWDTVGIHAVPPADGSGNGIPDYVDKCAAYLDSTITKQVAAGYLTPPSDGGAGGDGRYDVYFESMPYYGYAQPEALGPAPWNDATSYLVLHKNFNGFPTNLDPEGNQYGAMKVTIGHEFHHSIQFTYDYTEYSWFMELDATWTEDVVFPLTHDNYNYLSAFYSSPAMSLMTENASHEYSSFIWDKYLEQKFGQSLLRAVWEGARYGADVYATLSDTLLARNGWTQDSAFAEFAAWNYITGSRNDGLHLSDAANYPLMSIGRTHTAYPTTLQNSPNNPGGYAASYVKFVPQAVTGTLRITFDGADAQQWAMYIIKSTTNTSHQLQKVSVTPGTSTALVDVPNFQSYLSVTLVGINMTEFSGAASFQYSGSIVSTYELAAKFVTDTMVYSGATRQIQLQVKNLGPLSDVARVTANDTQGWVSFTFFDQAIASGDSQIVNIPVTAPVGTPLGTRTILTCKATSRSDTTKFDLKSQNETTVLQIGDVDFDGQIDISDLTALIGYLYLGGPPPVPVIGSGEFDCEPGLDVADLSTLISYLYLAGPPCPCRYF